MFVEYIDFEVGHIKYSFNKYAITTLNRFTQDEMEPQTYGGLGNMLRHATNHQNLSYILGVNVNSNSFHLRFETEAERDIVFNKIRNA